MSVQKQPLYIASIHTSYICFLEREVGKVNTGWENER